jgi:hypothetical protein
MEDRLAEQREKRRESTLEEERIVQEAERERLRKQQQDKRIQDNKKIRCPCCKKNMYFDQYLANKEIGTLVCSNCGVLFIDKDKLKVIKRNLAEAKKQQIIVGGK